MTLLMVILDGIIDVVYKDKNKKENDKELEVSRHKKRL